MSVEKERRAGGPRVPLHTLVEIGAGGGGSAAFEAESVDVTTAGMHLKTAYLPNIGEPLVCRFEGNRSEIVVHGQVAWRTEDSLGGDFGVRFLEIDQESLVSLRDLVGDPVESDEDNMNDKAQTNAHLAARGTRIRLHIDGLNSPMKARVREGTHGEVLVGSNLEFLRVGRDVEFENVDADDSRPARIERVSVEVEPTSHVPQLIVTLRYLDIEEQAPLTMAASYADDDQEADDGPAFKNDQGQAYADGEYEEESYANEGEEDEYEDEQGDFSEGRAAALWCTVRQLGPKFAVVGNAAREWGCKAKDAMGGAVTKAKNKATEKVKERQGAKRPVRTTAPPPKGALRGDGSRVNVAKEKNDKPNRKKKSNNKISQRTAMVALVTVLLMVVGIGFASNALWSRQDEETANAARGSEAAAGGDVPASALPEEDQTANDGNDPGDPLIIPGKMGRAAGGMDTAAGLVANVPLFGLTPMSTAAPMAPMAAVPAPAVAAVTPPPSDVAPVVGDDGDDSDEDMGAMAATVDNDDEADDSDNKRSSKRSSKTFSRGRVNDPVVLTLRMNQRIKGLRGLRKSDGFSVDVVGARSREPAAGLRRLDKRIASSKVVNRGSNATLSIRFRGTVPNYKVQAKGSTLQILIDGKKRTASSKKSRRGKSKRR